MKHSAGTQLEPLAKIGTSFTTILHSKRSADIGCCSNLTSRNANVPCFLSSTSPFRISSTLYEYKGCLPYPDGHHNSGSSMLKFAKLFVPVTFCSYCTQHSVSNFSPGLVATLYISTSSFTYSGMISIGTPYLSVKGLTS